MMMGKPQRKKAIKNSGGDPFMVKMKSGETREFYNEKGTNLWRSEDGELLYESTLVEASSLILPLEATKEMGVLVQGAAQALKELLETKEHNHPLNDQFHWGTLEYGLDDLHYLAETLGVELDEPPVE